MKKKVCILTTMAICYSFVSLAEDIPPFPKSLPAKADVNCFVQPVVANNSKTNAEPPAVFQISPRFSLVPDSESMNRVLKGRYHNVFDEANGYSILVTAKLVNTLAPGGQSTFTVRADIIKGGVESVATVNQWIELMEFQYSKESQSWETFVKLHLDSTEDSSLRLKMEKGIVPNQKYSYKGLLNGSEPGTMDCLLSFR